MHVNICIFIYAYIYIYVHKQTIYICKLLSQQGSIYRLLSLHFMLRTSDIFNSDGFTDLLFCDIVILDTDIFRYGVFAQTHSSMALFHMMT